MKLLLENWRQYLVEQADGPMAIQKHTFHNHGASDQVVLQNNELELLYNIDIKNDPQRNEPIGGMWTSTAEKQKDGSYASKWDEHNMEMGRGAGGSLVPTGLKQVWGSILLKPNPGAKILEIDDENYDILLQKYGEGAKKGYLNWKEIAGDYDAAHFSGASMQKLRTVDIESTIIFDLDAYTPVQLGTYASLLTYAIVASHTRDWRGQIQTKDPAAEVETTVAEIYELIPDLKNRAPTEKELLDLFYSSDEFKSWVYNANMKRK